MSNRHHTSIEGGGAPRGIFGFWLIAVGLEIVFAGLFLLLGADVVIERGLDRGGIDFGSDLVTAVRVLIAYPAALVAVLLAIGQVAAPDLAVWVRHRRDRRVLFAVARRIRPWSRAVGVRHGVRVWLAAILVFTTCNLASGLLHRAFVGEELTWTLSWSVLLLLPVAMFLDAGALFEESGWRGYALPVLLQRHGPVIASLLVGLAWATWHVPVKFDAFLEYGVAGGASYLLAFTLKLVLMSVVITFFWARAGQATLLAIVMHGMSNDVARVGGLVEGLTWQSATISELNLALPFAVAAVAVILVGRRRGWGDLRGLLEAEQPEAVAAGSGGSRRRV